MTAVPKTWWKKSILSWYALQGRHDLPWQQNLSPYSCWVSETMLQQTQVSTVIPYFERFMHHFPTVEALSAASIDTVLSFWSGLGYYARGRNLHRAAQMIVSDFGGIFPNTAEDLIRLPGIGPSTAHAILAQAFGEPAAILDGNVKRVLCRFFGVEGPLNQPRALKTLWTLATDYLPKTHAQEYAQAMMDLGALVCTQTKPQCTFCPLQSKCLGAQSGEPTRFPLKIKRPPKPTQEGHFLLLSTKDAIGLVKRPDSGIWGGLWCLPEKNMLAPKANWRPSGQMGPHRHSFTHFHLEYYVSGFQIARPSALLSNMTWVSPQEALELGLPSPIRKIIESYHENRLLPKAKTRTARA